MNHYSTTTRPSRASWGRSSTPRTVYKYPAPCFNKVLTLALPKGATILSAVILNQELYIYAEVDEKQQSEIDCYQFQAVGTGYIIDVDQPRFFLGTVLLPLTPTYAEVYHIYYHKNRLCT